MALFLRVACMQRRRDRAHFIDRTVVPARLNFFHERASSDALVVTCVFPSIQPAIAMDRQVAA